MLYWAEDNGMTFGMNHIPGAGPIALPVVQGATTVLWLPSALQWTISGCSGNRKHQNLYKIVSFRTNLLYFVEISKHVL